MKLKIFVLQCTLTATSPSSFSVSPRNADSNDDFPLPTGPTTATRDPAGMSKLMLKENGKRLGLSRPVTLVSDPSKTVR